MSQEQPNLLGLDRRGNSVYPADVVNTTVEAPRDQEGFSKVTVTTEPAEPSLSTVKEEGRGTVGLSHGQAEDAGYPSLLTSVHLATDHAKRRGEDINRNLNQGGARHSDQASGQSGTGEGGQGVWDRVGSGVDAVKKNTGQIGESAKSTTGSTMQTAKDKGTELYETAEGAAGNAWADVKGTAQGLAQGLNPDGHDREIKEGSAKTGGRIGHGVDSASGTAEAGKDRAGQAWEGAKHRVGDATTAAQQRLHTASDALTPDTHDDDIKRASASAGERIGQGVDTAGDVANKGKGQAGEAWEGAKDGVTGLGEGVKQKVDGAWDTTKDTAERAGQTAADAAQGAKDTSRSWLGWAKGRVGTATTRAKSTTSSVLPPSHDQEIKSASASTGERVSDAVDRAADVTGSAQIRAAGAAQSAKDSAQQTFEGVKARAEGTAKGGKDVAQGTWDTTKERASGLNPESHDREIKQGSAQVGEGISHAVDRAADAASTAQQKAAGTFDAAKHRAGDATQTAKDTATGAWDATKQRASDVTEGVKGRAQGAVSAVNPGSHDREIKQGSAQVGEGLRHGVDRTASAASAAQSRATGAATTAKDTAQHTLEGAKARAEGTVEGAKDVAQGAWGTTKQRASGLNPESYDREIKQGSAQVGEGISHAVDRAANAASAAQHKAAETFDATKQRASDVTTSAQQTAGGAWDATKHRAVKLVDTGKATALGTAESVNPDSHDKEIKQGSAQVGESISHAVDRAADAASAAQNKAADTFDATKQRAGDATQAVKDTAGGALEATKERAAQVAQGGKEAALRAAEAVNPPTYDSEIKQGAAQVGEGISHTIDRAADAASAAQHRVTETLDATKQRAGEVTEAGKERLQGARTAVTPVSHDSEIKHASAQVGEGLSHAVDRAADLALGTQTQAGALANKAYEVASNTLTGVKTNTISTVQGVQTAAKNTVTGVQDTARGAVAAVTPTPHDSEIKQGSAQVGEGLSRVVDRAAEAVEGAKQTASGAVQFVRNGTGAVINSATGQLKGVVNTVTGGSRDVAEKGSEGAGLAVDTAKGLGNQASHGLQFTRDTAGQALQGARDTAGQTLEGAKQGVQGGLERVTPQEHGDDVSQAAAAAGERISRAVDVIADTTENIVHKASNVAQGAKERVVGIGSKVLGVVGLGGSSSKDTDTDTHTDTETGVGPQGVRLNAQGPVSGLEGIKQKAENISAQRGASEASDQSEDIASQISAKTQISPEDERDRDALSGTAPEIVATPYTGGTRTIEDRPPYEHPHTIVNKKELQDELKTTPSSSATGTPLTFTTTTVGVSVPSTTTTTTGTTGASETPEAAAERAARDWARQSFEADKAKAVTQPKSGGFISALTTALEAADASIKEGIHEEEAARRAREAYEAALQQQSQEAAHPLQEASMNLSGGMRADLAVEKAREVFRAEIQKLNRVEPRTLRHEREGTAH